MTELQQKTDAFVDASRRLFKLLNAPDPMARFTLGTSDKWFREVQQAQVEWKQAFDALEACPAPATDLQPAHGPDKLTAGA